MQTSSVLDWLIITASIAMLFALSMYILILAVTGFYELGKRHRNRRKSDD